MRRGFICVSQDLDNLVWTGNYSWKKTYGLFQDNFGNQRCLWWQDVWKENPPHKMRNLHVIDLKEKGPYLGYVKEKKHIGS